MCSSLRGLKISKLVTLHYTKAYPSFCRMRRKGVRVLLPQLRFPDSQLSEITLSRNFIYI